MLTRHLKIQVQLLPEQKDQLLYVKLRSMILLFNSTLLILLAISKAINGLFIGRVIWIAIKKKLKPKLKLNSASRVVIQ
jgi:uncharacterized membrane protein